MDDLSQLTRLGLFDSRVPRYTSYPTAPRFNANVGAPDMAFWISQIPPGSKVSLYIHVPFCRHLCWFCACRTQGTRNPETVRKYLTTLKAEIALLKATLPSGVTLSRLHLGGGTPTIMSPDMLRDLADTIFDMAPLADGSEFSVEIDPNEIDANRIDALADAGMTRASVGVQDFQPEIQAAIGREQSYEVTRDTIDALRDKGLASLNADILYGLPHQTRASLSESVQRLLSLSPDRVALYGYAHVPWMARRQSLIPSESLPTPNARLELFNVARRLFAWDGYEEIGIDHFARPHDGLAKAAEAGTLRRNFQGYTDDTATVLIGLGASSISRFPGGYAQNASGTGEYTKRIRAGEFAIVRGHRFGGDDTLRARIIEALMCDFQVSTRGLVATFGAIPDDISRIFEDVCHEFAGFVDGGPEGLSIRSGGRPLTRMIARRFDAYDLANTGHSPAI